MKNKFKKVGDKVKVVKNKTLHGFKIGEIIKISKVNAINYRCYNLDRSENWLLCEDEIIPFKPSLIITIKPSIRNGVKSFRWVLKHKNGRNSNHSYNSEASAKKELTKFLDAIKNEDYEIVIK